MVWLDGQGGKKRLGGPCDKAVIYTKMLGKDG